MLSEHSETPQIPQQADINAIAERLVNKSPDVTPSQWIERINRMISGLEKNNPNMPGWMEKMLSAGIFEGCTAQDLLSIRLRMDELLSRRN